MGSLLSCCCSQLDGFAISVCVEVVNASPDVVWESIADIESHPNYLSMVSSVHRNGTTEWEEGTSWHETRVYKQKPYILRKSITNIISKKDDSTGDDVQYSVSINVRFDHESNALNTSTLSIYPVKTDDKAAGTTSNKCRLVGTLAWMNESLYGKLHYLLCGYFAISYVREAFHNELEEIATEAEKREKRSTSSRKNNPIHYHELLSTNE